jgi:peptidyl-prolyl cis-trans isomerase SurA
MKLSITLACLLFSASPRQLVDQIVAIINEDVITMSELEESSRNAITRQLTDAQKKEAQKQVLEALIKERLISQQIDAANISVSASDVDRAIEDITRQNNISRDDLQKAVLARNMTWEKYRSDLEQQIVRLKLVDLKVRSRVSIPDAEIRAVYDEEVSRESAEKLITLRHLFFRWGESPDPSERGRVLKMAQAGQKRLLLGEDFAKVAKEMSQGPSANSGGGLGDLDASSLLPELARAVRKLKVMEISAPIETQNGVHVIQIQKRQAKAPPPFEQRRNPIYQRLYQSEVERQMGLWIQELKKKSVIETRL